MKKLSGWGDSRFPGARVLAPKPSPFAYCTNVHHYLLRIFEFLHSGIRSGGERRHLLLRGRDHLVLLRATAISQTGVYSHHLVRL